MEPLEKKRRKLARQEQQLLARRAQRRPGAFAGALGRAVPAGLRRGLESAFCSAFGLVFQKGVGVIEKTLRPDEARARFAMRDALLRAGPTARRLRQLEKDARRGQAAAQGAALLEGAALGVLGIGLPDIPVFTGVLLRGVYEVAMGYGFGYETPEERAYILCLVCGALAVGPDAPRWAAEADRLGRAIGRGGPFLAPAALQSYIASAGRQLSAALLAAKFIQGLPLVGAVGGAANLAVYRQVLGWAALKYQQRYLAALCAPGCKKTGAALEGKPAPAHRALSRPACAAIPPA